MAWAVLVVVLMIGGCLVFPVAIAIAIGVGLLFIGLCVLSTLRSLAFSLMVSDVAVVVADFAHIL